MNTYLKYDENMQQGVRRTKVCLIALKVLDVLIVAQLITRLFTWMIFARRLDIFKRRAFCHDRMLYQDITDFTLKALLSIKSLANAAF